MSSPSEISLTITLDTRTGDGINIKIPYRPLPPSEASRRPSSVAVNIAGVEVTVSPVGRVFIGNESQELVSSLIEARPGSSTQTTNVRSLAPTLPEIDMWETCSEKSQRSSNSIINRKKGSSRFKESALFEEWSDIETTDCSEDEDEMMPVSEKSLTVTGCGVEAVAEQPSESAVVEETDHLPSSADTTQIGDTLKKDINEVTRELTKKNITIVPVRSYSLIQIYKVLFSTYTHIFNSCPSMKKTRYAKRRTYKKLLANLLSKKT